jgi:putative PIN family toxin of toxin-antitoxin system
MPKPRAVLDTNVVVSAHLRNDGLERFVLDLALTGKIQLFVSDPILEEYRNVLTRPKFRIDPVKAAASLHLIEEASTKIRPLKQVKAARDPDDNKFLECALGAQADYLVTGNKKHFPKRCGQTLIVNAKEFLQQITPDLRR